MLRPLFLAVLGLVAAAPAVAGDAPPRLVTGSGVPHADGSRFGGADAKAELFANGGLRLGALLDSTPAEGDGADRAAFGGYATYLLDSFSLGSSLRGDATASAADVTASYALGDGTAELSLGYQWAGRPTAFSVSPFQAAGGLGGGALNDLTLSLSFTHDVTPSFSLGGFAGAVRSEYEDRTTEHGFRLGAGLGYRF